MRRFTLFLTLVSALFNLFAEEISAPKIVLGPYIQACGEREFTVIWKSDCNAVSWVEIAPDDGTHFYNTARQQFFETIHGRRPIGLWHKVKITGLEPGVKYRYRILHKGVVLNQGNKRVRYSESKGSNVYRRQPYCVRTLNSSSATVRFAVGNDFHDKPELLSQLFSKDIVAAKGYDFVLFNGDMVSSFESEQRMVDGVLTPAATQFASETPLFYARGNHETRGSYATHYSEFFPTSTSAPYYTFKAGPALFIVLDAGEDKPDSDVEYHDLVRYDHYRRCEAEWLKSVAQSDDFKQAAVKIAIIHIPPKSNGWHGEAEVAKLFVPILNNAGIDAMFCGHIHKYRFTEPGEQFSGCNFPVVCNPNRSRMDIEITKEKIVYSIIDAENKEIVTNEISLKQ